MSSYTENMALGTALHRNVVERGRLGIFHVGVELSFVAVGASVFTY